MPWKRDVPWIKDWSLSPEFSKVRGSAIYAGNLVFRERLVINKFLNRYKKIGPEGLEDLSRRPHSIQNKTSSTKEYKMYLDGVGRMDYIANLDQILPIRRVLIVENLQTGLSGGDKLWPFFCQGKYLIRGFGPDNKPGLMQVYGDLGLNLN